MHSKCGFSCGFMVEKKSMFNPLDDALVKLSAYFPLDYILFFVFTSYIFICVIYGIVKFGFSFMCFKGYELRKSASLPQSIIIVAFIVNVSILVLSSQLLTLAP